MAVFTIKAFVIDVHETSITNALITNTLFKNTTIVTFENPITILQFGDASFEMAIIIDRYK